ncbi:MAG: alpha/beta hydrolase [Deltaproteobacteria bacterium]|nr:alpha/beta hydrolase [Deltaproteobacteria bacterium]
MPAPTFALLHGLPFHSGLWAPLCAAAGPRLRARVVAVNLPGYGGAPALRGPATLQAHLDAIEAALAAAGAPAGPDLHLVGHEFGGLLAALLALRRGAASLGLLSTSLGPAWLLARLAAAPLLHRPFYRWRGGALYRDHSVALVDRARVAAAFPLPGTVAFADQMRAAGQGISARALWGLEARLAAAGLPLRLAWGADDQTFPLRQGARLARRLGAPLTVVPGARHLGLFTHPEAFVGAVFGGVEGALAR